MIRQIEKSIWNNQCIPHCGHTGKARRRHRKFEIKSVTPAVLLMVAHASWAHEVHKKLVAVRPTVNKKAIALLDSWIGEDVGDQKETWTELIKAIDENRLSNRKLFS